MKIDFVGMFQVWITSLNNRFYPILFVLLFAFLVRVFAKG